MKNNTLEHDGLVRLTQFLSVETAQRLAGVAQLGMNLFADREKRHRTGGEYGEAELCGSYDGWRGLGLGALMEYMGDSPERAALGGAAAEAVAAVQSFLGSKASFLPSYSFFRQVSGAAGGVGWHCDAEAASLMAVGKSCCTVWLPLSPVGNGLPSLEFVPGSHKIMRGRGDLALCNHRSVQEVDQLALRKRYVPIIDPIGDAILFDMYTLHRTQPLETITPRLNCEFRFKLD